MRFLKDIIASADAKKSLIKDFLTFKYFVNQDNLNIDIIFSVCHEDIQMVDFQSFLDGFIHHLQFTTKLVSYIYPGFSFKQEDYDVNFPIQLFYKNEEDIKTIFEKIKSSKDFQGIFWFKRKEEDFKFEKLKVYVLSSTGSIETSDSREIEEQLEIDIP